MNISIEEYIAERIKIFDKAMEEEMTNSSTEETSTAHWDRVIFLIESLDNKWIGSFLNTYVLFKKHNLDKFEPYLLKEITPIDMHNSSFTVQRVGRNMELMTHKEINMRSGSWVSTSKEGIMDIRGWHETGMKMGGERYLYILRNEMGRIKIGQSINVEQRNHSIRIQAGLSIEILNKISESSRFETVLHRVFKSKRYAGEWFDLNDAEIRWLCDLNEINIDAEISYIKQLTNPVS